MHEERIEEPVFYKTVRAFILLNLPQFSLMEAVTFDDVIVSHGTLQPAVLLHECVHVTQFRLLGVERFAGLYVRGFLAGGGYEQIPLEVCANYLVDRHAQEGKPFNVEEEVLKWIKAGRFG